MAAPAREELVEAVTRAMALLDAFTIHDATLRLTELARRVGLAKSSTLRLARTLAAAGYLAPGDDGGWRLGPAAAWLGARYQAAFDLHHCIEPEMQKLAALSGESVSYFVHDGHARIRLAYVGTRTDGVRRIGEPMPLERGSPGQVLLAFAGAKGNKYEAIRKRGFHLTIGEARRGGASVSAPVFGSRWNVLGALCIGIPAGEASEELLAAHVPELLASATRLSRLLAKQQASITPSLDERASWHPR